MLDTLHNIYPSLYGKIYDEKEMDKRFLLLLDEHKRLYKNSTPHLFSSSGRTELCGNHTDHNLGYALSSSINLDSIASVSKRDDDIISLVSEGYSPIMVDLRMLSVDPSLYGTTASLIMGIAKGFLNYGYKIGGWNGNASSYVLSGSGLSSSASIEVLIGEVFNALYNDGKVSKIEIAKIGQYAENTFYNKPCGLLDQLSCAVGGIIKIDFKDKDNPDVKKCPFSLEEYGYSIVIVNTHSGHDGLDYEYSLIPKEMKSVASFFGKSTLRDVKKEDFLDNIHSLRTSLKDDRALLRAYHYFNENERVLNATKSMENGDISSFLKNIRESGDSSIKYLQNIHIDSKNEALSLALMLSSEVIGEDGAYRVHGGGFAGTIQAFMKKEKVSLYTKKMDELFGKGSSTEIAIRHSPSLMII